MQDWIDNQPGKDWREASERLAQWTEERLVNRDDVYRAFKSPERRYLGQLITYTGPWLEESRDYGSLSCDVIERHYRGDDPGKLIGLHAISVENTSRWFAIDIDQHGEDGPVQSEENLAAALAGMAICNISALRHFCSTVMVRAATTCWCAYPMKSRPG